MSCTANEPAPVIARNVQMRRPWLLALLAALAGIAFGVAAASFDGNYRVAFGGASLVFLITAFLCAGFTSLESQHGPLLDLEEPPPMPPPPQAQVTILYDPREKPNNSLERDAAKPRASR